MPRPEYCVELELSPPPGLAQLARGCGEDPRTRLQAIAQLRDLVYERGECSPHRMDDEYLVRFLRARNFVPARAHRLMVNYYRFKEENRSLCVGVYPLELRRVGDSGVLAVPPYRGADGRRLLIYRLGCWDPKAVPVEELLRATLLALELGVLEPRTQVLGGAALLDLAGAGPQHAWQVTPAVAAKVVKMLVSSFPASTHAIHIVNHSWVFDKIFSVFRPLLTAEMRARVLFHADLASLHRHVPPAHLPEQYGGDWPHYPYTVWLDSLRGDHRVVRELLSSGYRFRAADVSAQVAQTLKEQGVELE